ncbi:MAG: RDD family protein [Elusimicrobia bacterium]|nr:RDD family protein [Elusimicrobiota bacterium]
MEPAERSDRLKAALIDGGLGLVLSLLSGVPMIGWVAGVAMIVLVGVQLYLLATQGQTLGKRFMSIRIVRRDTLENGGFLTNVVLRTFVNFLLCIVPAYPVIDCLLIFRDDRRCVHDHLAGTVVVKG